MDGIRVQPYGRPDVDYLSIEERRSLGAGYYYFSYRRMFGAVRLTSEHNRGLQEKAGREGFTRGRAYTDFQRLLINLFEELAARFFRADGPQVQAYDKGRKRLKREDMPRKERVKRGPRKDGGNCRPDSPPLCDTSKRRTSRSRLQRQCKTSVRASTTLTASNQQRGPSPRRGETCFNCLTRWSSANPKASLLQRLCVGT